MKLTDTELNAVSICKAMRDAARGEFAGSLEAEICGQAARESGKMMDDHTFMAPWAMFTPKPIAMRLAQRDMTAAGVSGSQYLVSTENQQPIDALRPWSVVTKAGATILSNLVGDINIPVSAGSAGYWLPTEGSAGTETNVSVVQKSLSPKTAIVLVETTHQFRQQAAGGDLDGFVQRDLGRTLGALLDVAVLSGTGTSGQPHGLRGTTGVGTYSGTSLGWGGIQSLLNTIAENNAGPDESIHWVGHPGVRQILAARSKFGTYGDPIWDGLEIAGYRAHATTAAPAADLAVGPWDQCVVGVWGAGPIVSVNPFSDFGRGFISYRMMLSCDVAFLNPAYFGYVESIT